jgi:hypothetical protein
MGHPINGDDDRGEAEGEEQHELELALRGHGAAEDNGDREQNQRQVCHDIADGHCQELHIPLAASAPWVRQCLPVVREGLAFDQVAYHNGDECCDKESANEHEGQVIGPPPGDIEPPEKFEDGILENP